jgi:glycosyltransferase involved in cell wall biosynthesis
MPKLSIIIPSKNELFLFHTIEDIFSKGHGDFEVIAVLDGYWPAQMPKEHKNLVLLHHGTGQGMRSSINDGVSIARGKYLMKCDGHCMFAEGFDETLIKECEDNWVVVPRRLSLDAERWEPKPDRAPIDYHFLSYPYEKPEEIGMHGQPWPERAKERKDILLDDEMSSQGSCWFMSKKHFDRLLGGLSSVGYGTFVQEFQEI